MQYTNKCSIVKYALSYIINIIKMYMYPDDVTIVTETCSY